MHAKRTRDRKKVFVQDITRTIEMLNEENLMLKDFLEEICPEDTFSMTLSTHNSNCNGRPQPKMQPNGFASNSTINMNRHFGSASNNIPLTINVPTHHNNGGDTISDNSNHSNMESYPETFARLNQMPNLASYYTNSSQPTGQQNRKRSSPPPPPPQPVKRSKRLRLGSKLN